MTPAQPRIAIACGGSGGHLFPGLAVAQELRARGCSMVLFVSRKAVDQQALKNISGMDIVALPANAFQAGARFAFARGFFQACLAARRSFHSQPPLAALAMGGFTSAAPLLAARSAGAKTFLHESNAIPGRANRWLSWMATGAFIAFPSAAEGLHTSRPTLTGTPVRAEFRARDGAECRAALGFDPARPVILVMGGSQGASGLNRLVLEALPEIAASAPHWQWLHLAGSREAETVSRLYAALNFKAVVHPFFDAMELALGAASAAVSRAGASSLAELAAMRLPAVLVPYPDAAGNHQFFNARVFAETGAARLLEQNLASAGVLASLLLELVQNSVMRERTRLALAQWHVPDAAAKVAEAIFNAVAVSSAPRDSQTTAAADCGPRCASSPIS